MKVALGSADTPDGPRVVREVVGVARQVKERPDETEDFLQIYVPMAQDPVDDIYLLVRPASGRAEALAPSVRAAIGRIDKEQLVSVRDVMTLEDVAWDATGRHRFRAVMVVTFAALALLLAMVGVFGILAYSVQQRVRDFGVRRALGATTSDVFRLVVESAARVVATGTLVGLILSAAFARLLASDAVRCPAAGSGDVRIGHRPASPHCRPGHCRTGVASNAYRPGGGAEEGVTRGAMG